MGRKSRLKRERGVADLASAAAEIRRATEPEEVVAGPPAPPAPRPSRSPGRRAKRQAVGATPASIRLGELVDAEVERSRNPATDGDVATAMQAIRSQIDELEALVRRAAPPA
jgi:hypothetical protein